MTKTEKKELKVYNRHKRFWKFARQVPGPIIMKIFGCKSEAAENLPEPYIVLSNHTTDLDPAIVGISFPSQMYFIASEHVYRHGFVSKLLFWVFQPIAKIKGSSDRLMVMKAIRTLKEGKNLCLFPEGNRSFNGRNSPITDAIGKMVKVSGANLVTYRIKGGFFTNPRWGYGIRKGKMTGAVVNVYTAEQLQQMTPEQITSVIREDIKEDAYETQRLWNIKYKAKRFGKNNRYNLAFGMECAYCVCPKCSDIGKIYTDGNSVYCKNCGRLADYDEYGYFTELNNGFDFETLEDWDDWQEKYFENLAVSAREKELFFEEKDVGLRIITSEHEEKELGTGTLSLYKDALEFVSSENTVRLEIKELPDMGMYGKKGLVFTDSKGIHYELVCDRLINVRKYISMWNYLRRNLKGV